MKADISSVAFLTVIVGMAISGILTIATSWVYFLKPLNLVIVALFATSGIFQYGVSRRFFYSAIRNLGANITSPIIMVTLTVSGVLAGALLLNERVAVLMVPGIALVIFGGVLLEARQAAGLRGGATRGGYLAAIASGIIPAFTAVMVSYGLSIYPFVISSVFISYSAAFFYFLFAVRVRSIGSLLKTSPKRSVIAFAFAGVIALTAQLFRTGALELAPVVLVIPFSTSSNLFIPFFTWQLAKDVELFNLRTMIGIVVITLGLIMISL